MMALLLVRVGVPFNLKLIIMAKVYTNDKNFLVIEMNGAEASGLGFGVEIPGCLNAIVCGGCNSQIEHKEIYYIAGINEVMCKDCADDYIKNMSHYTDIDSLKYEISHFNIIAQKLGMSEKASFTVDNKIVITA
jgi:hypothetical protein